MNLRNMRHRTYRTSCSGYLVSAYEFAGDGSNLKRGMCLRRLMADIVCFFFVFNFQLIKGLAISSSFAIALGLALCYLLISDSAKQRISSLVNSGYFKTIAILISTTLLYSGVSVILHATDDYSYCEALFKALLVIVGSIIFFVFLVDAFNVSAVETIIDIFILQSFIIVLSFFNANFKEATDVFRTDGSILTSERYSGYRGLALAGSAYYGLAIAYSFIYVLVAHHWATWSIKLLPLKICLLGLLIFAGITAGRTAAVGLPFAAIILVADSIRRRGFRVKSRASILFGFLALSLICFATLLFMIVKPNLSDIPPQLLNFRDYAFSFIENFNPSDIMSSTSSTEQLSKMYFPLSFDQLLVGDGMYTLSTGFYYMSTDAGYMRTVLFFGVPGLVLILMCQLCILRPSNGSAFFSGVVFLLLCILEYKGEAVLLPMCLNSVIMLVQLDYRFTRMSNDN